MEGTSSADFRPFPSTDWGMVARAGQRDQDGDRAALGQLIVQYLPALRAHLLLNMKISPDHADDLLQGGVTDKMLERELVSRASRQRGRFRSFLRTALKNYVISSIRREKAKKRSPGDSLVLDINEDPGLIPAEDRPSDPFDEAWGREVIAEALRRMKSACETSGRPDIWGVFESRILRPTLEGAKPPAYNQLVERFRFRSPAQASNVLITAKRMFVRLLRFVVSEYVQDESEIDAEIEELKEILSRTRAG